MSFFKRLANLFSSQSSSDDWARWITVQCNRCGEQIQARIDLRNDLSINYGDGEGDVTYFCRKTLMGEERCFQRIEIELTYDKDRKLIDRQIQGGKFVDESAG